MKKLKFIALLSIISILFTTISHSQIEQQLPTLTFTRLDANPSIGSTVKMTLRTPLSGSLFLSKGTQTFSNLSSHDFIGKAGNDYSTYTFKLEIPGVGTSPYHSLPVTYDEGEIVIFDMSSYSVAVTVYRTGALTWELSAIYGPPLF